MLNCPKCGKELNKIYSTNVHSTTNLLAYENGEYNTIQDNIDGQYDMNTLVECGYCGTDITHLTIEGLPDTEDFCD